MAPELYFISILVLTTNVIPTGWLQWSQSFADKAVCETIIERDKTELVDAIQAYLEGQGPLVQKIECLTYDEAVKRNTGLGH